MISMLPRAAGEYRRQITLGLDNDPRAAGKERAILRKLLGPIDLRPGSDKSLWAEYEICPAALLITGTAGASTDGSGGRISPSALRAPVALAANRDAPASLRLRVNLLSTQNQILPQ